MPYSPNATRVPPLAVPCRSGRCCLRCAILRGMSMPSALLGHGCDRSLAAGGPRRVLRARALARGRAAAPGGRAVPVAALAGPHRRLERLTLGAGGRRLAAVDPDLDPDPAERGPRLVEAVVDVGAQRVQRHPALAVELRPRHLRAAE